MRRRFVSRETVITIGDFQIVSRGGRTTHTNLAGRCVDCRAELGPIETTRCGDCYNEMGRPA